MPEGGDEIEAAVDPIVHDVPAVEAALVVEVALKLVVDVADDGAETGREKGEGQAPLRGNDRAMGGGVVGTSLGC